MRQQLTAPLVLNVSPSGNDSNDGITAPLATPNAAAALVANNYDPCGQQVKIQLARGTYPPIQLSNYIDAGLVAQQTNAVIVGDPCNPGEYVISAASGSAVLAVGVRSTWTIRGVTLESSDPNGYGLEADFGSNVYLDSPQFGNCGLGFVVALFGSKVEFLGRAGKPLFTIAGNTQNALWAIGAGTYIILQDVVGGLPFQFLNGPSWAQFCRAEDLAEIYMGIGYSGAYNGQHPLWLDYYGHVKGVANVPAQIGGSNYIENGGWCQ